MDRDYCWTIAQWRVSHNSCQRHCRLARFSSGPGSIRQPHPRIGLNIGWRRLRLVSAFALFLRVLEVIGFRPSHSRPALGPATDAHLSDLGSHEDHDCQANPKSGLPPRRCRLGHVSRREAGSRPVPRPAGKLPRAAPGATHHSGGGAPALLLPQQTSRDAPTLG